MTLQPDGKVLIGGQFIYVNDMAINRIARLHTDGTLDRGFDPGSGLNWPASAMALQPDGKVLIGGGFTSVNGTAMNRIARLMSDGTLDKAFDPGSGADATVRSIALQPDGKILIGGSFTTVNGTTIGRIARLLGGGVLSPAQQFASVTSESGSLGSDIAAESTPHGDGVNNLLKYAFNMNLADKDTRTMPPGGTAGLPTITTQPNTPAGTLRFEFVRRIGSGLIYTPQKSPDPGNPASWAPLTDTPSLEPIDATWERLTYEVKRNQPNVFFRVAVRLP